MTGLPRSQFLIVLAILLIVMTFWKTTQSQKDAAGSLPQRRVVVGTASYYGPGFEGKRTASGDRFHSYEFTAAHRSLPLGTEVRVTNLENRRAVVVEITDRGPYVRGRMIDLSAGAARRLRMRKQGLTRVRVEILNQPSLDY